MITTYSYCKLVLFVFSTQLQLQEMWSRFELMHVPGAAPSRPGPRSCVKYDFEHKFVVVHRTLFNQGVHEIPIRVLMHIVDALATTGAFKGFNERSFDMAVAG